MPVKVQALLLKLKRVIHNSIEAQDSIEESQSLVYGAEDPTREKIHSIKRNIIMKLVLQSLFVITLMIASYVYGIRSLRAANLSTGFVPNIPVLPGSSVFADDQAWIGPGSESDILWAEEYQVMSEHKFIKIDDPEKYGMPPGQIDSNDVNFYSVSVYHQLHCLALFRALVYDEFLSTNDGNYKRSLNQNRTQEDWYHLGHCFHYLRQAIRCTVDTTLEFPPVMHTN